ncbi:ABC transporter ATP-binding protein [Corynebacterium sp. LK2510]|uniref:ABC transporter ATP-binding protein n=1 Tax=Corynebacterium sp. LK2510 TaxID=3110472 RepID=UPI0034CEF83F
MSFIAEKGEAVGIIGKNGSGKSTLLNMIAGHENPSSGDILVSARPSLLSVSAALQQHLTGMENIRLGLLASGLPPEKVAEIEQSVADWADIGEAVDRPLRTYSSGMGARLKFSIATAVRPEILLVDEALATGDTTFTARAQERMAKFLEGASTVFVVSHAPAAITDTCSRALWLNEGELVVDGPSDFVCAQYSRWSKAIAARDRVTANKVLRRIQQEFRQPNLIFSDGRQRKDNRGRHQRIPH